MITLREVNIDDGKYIVEWRNSLNVRIHVLNRDEVTLESNEKFYKEKILTGKYKQYMVEKTEDGYPVVYTIATVYLKDIDNLNKRCELCIMPNNDEEWNDEAKIEAMKMLVEKSFKKLGMKKIYSYVFADCQDEIDLMKKTGFEEECILEKEVFVENHFRDLIRFCMFCS